MTPRELIAMLGQWSLDEPFDLHVLNNCRGGSQPIIVLSQELNTINLSEKD